MNEKLGLTGKIGYGIGAIGKDMVYMLSASYILYYFQDVLGVNAVAMGIILSISCSLGHTYFPVWALLS